MQNSQVPKIGSHMPSLEHMQHMEMLAESWHTRSRILQTIAAKELTYQKQNALAKISQVVKILPLLGDLVPANTFPFPFNHAGLPRQPFRTAWQGQNPFAGLGVKQPFAGPHPGKGRNATNM